MEIKQALILDENEPLSKAAEGIRDSRTAVIITKNGRYSGIIDDRNLRLKTVQSPAKTKCKTVIVKPPVLTKDTGILERIDAFLLGHFKALPVINERDKPIGITTRVELLDDMIKNNLMPRLHVKELMNAPVYTLDYKKSVGEAKLKMKKYRAGRLIITRMGNAIGTFSTFDLARETLRPRKKQRMATVISTSTGYDDLPVSGLYRSDLTTIKSDSTVEQAARKMIRKEVSSVVIVSGKKHIGVVSAIDIFKVIKKATKKTMDVGISGLDDETILYRDAIREDVEKVANIFAETYGIRRVNVHVKKGKSIYTINIFVEGNRDRFTVRTEGPSMKDTVNMAVAELRKQLARTKHVKKSRKVRSRGGRYGG